MKTLATFLFFALCQFHLLAQGVGINETGSAPESSAILDVSSESGTKGVLLPRLSTAQRDAIAMPAQGLTIFNIETNCYDLFDGSIWRSVCGNTGPSSPTEEKPRMLGYGGGVGGASRGVPTNSFHDIDVRITYEQSEVFIELTEANMQYRLITNEWPDARYPRSVVVLDGYLYMLIVSQNLTPQQWRVYRYDIANIAAGGLQMNFAGLSLVASDNMLQMTSSHSGVFYFTYEAGNSISDFDIAKYNLAGTTFNYIESVTFGAEPNSFDRIMVDNEGDVYGIKTPAADNVVRKFDAAGNLIYVTPPYVMGGNQTSPKVLNWDDTFYFGSSAIDLILNRIYLE